MDTEEIDDYQGTTYRLLITSYRLPLQLQLRINQPHYPASSFTITKALSISSGLLKICVQCLTPN